MSVSVVIPTLNEATCIAATIGALRSQGPCQIIVVDGGSNDDTARQAAHADRVLTAPPGRAAQMNLGAASATGAQLLFLHADCILAPGALAAMRGALARSDIAGGCFTMRVQAEGWRYRCIDAAASARVRLTGVVYGDQGLWLRRRDFETLGGFPPVRLMEDVFFSRSLRRLGRVIVLPQRILVSARRWQNVGVVRQSLRNWTLTALALGGIHPDRLAPFYPHVR